MRTSFIPVLLYVAAAAAPATAQQGGADPLDPRRIFDGEICQVDGLTAAECDCAWQFVQGKLNARDLRTAMLLTAAGSESSDLAKKADKALDGSSVSDRRRDELQSEISALTVEAEDRCSP